jgi:hypothetical protein
MEKETDRTSEEEEEFYKLKVSPFFSQKSWKKEANSLKKLWRLCCLKRTTEQAYAKKLLLPVPVLHTETTKARVSDKNLDVQLSGSSCRVFVLLPS